MAAELGSLQGHPVHLLVAAANSDLEKWLETELAKEDYDAPEALARQFVVLINGLLMIQLVTHSAAYGQDIGGLVRNLLAGHKKRKAA